MTSKPLENNGGAAKRQVAGKSGTDHTAPNAAENSPAYLTAEKLEVQKLFAPASTFARIAARIRAATKSGLSKKEVKQQKEAVSTWEDEGGTAAAKKPSTVLPKQ